METFHWSACEGRLAELAVGRDFRFDPARRCFESAEMRILPPLVLPLPGELLSAAEKEHTASEISASKGREDNADLQKFLKSLPEELGIHCLILMQAGAASLGFFADGELLASKTLKRYVVRGKGRAQPTFLKSKGKSRYGSRLRLQNARLLIEEINAKLTAYWKEFGSPESLFVGAPVRLWPDLFRGKQQPPFGRDYPVVRIPLDLPVPSQEVLLRTYKSLCYGRIEREEPRLGAC